VSARRAMAFGGRRRNIGRENVSRRLPYFFKNFIFHRISGTKKDRLNGIKIDDFRSNFNRPKTDPPGILKEPCSGTF
jgi:hypothetical protein